MIGPHGRSLPQFDDAVMHDPAPRRFDPGDASTCSSESDRPPVSDPIEPKHNPAAVATPQPLEDTPTTLLRVPGIDQWQISDSR